MLIENGLAKHYWAKAVNTTNYVLNRCLIWPILKKYPYELLNRRTPKIAYLRSFGCKCFIHNNGKGNLGKFDAKSDEGIFPGYSLNSKTYRVLNKCTSMVEESIHIVFDVFWSKLTGPLLLKVFQSLLRPTLSGEITKIPLDDSKPDQPPL